MNPSLQLRPISKEQLAACNVLHCSPLFVEVQWLSNRWRWNFQHATTPDSFPVHIVADWSGAKVIVRGSAVWLERVTASLAGDVDIGMLPKQLQVAIAEAAFSDLVGQIESLGKRPLRIESVEIDKGASANCDEFDKMNVLQWEAECDGLAYRGEIWLDRDGLAQAAELSRFRTSHRRVGQRWIELPVPIRFLVGATTLPLNVYRSLELNDVVLLDDCWLTKDGILTASPGPGKAFRGRIDGAQLTVMEGLKRIMEDPAYNEQVEFDSDNDESQVCDLPVKLTFDLGDRTMQIGELQSLEPGYVFDLGRDLRQSVIIRANGVRVGEGELVDIAGRTGVVLLALSGKDE